jgi:geranylgeranyl diphosphate synthase, type II
MYTFKELQEIVNTKLKDLQIGQKPAELYDPIKYILDAGGKRMRPILVLAANNLFTDTIEAAIEPALAMEVFHNFTLLHDDLMDKADVRRNRSTVHKKWNDNIAILSGDAMMIKAYQLIVKAPSKNLAKIIQLFNQTALEVCEGQQHDMNFEQRMDVSENEYIEMIRLKTSVLVAACLKIGALCADTNEKDAQKLYDFGVNLGLAFQLQDDYLDTYGDPKTFGKKIGGDIVANKKTFMLIKAQELAKGEQAKTLHQLITESSTNSEEKIKAVTQIYNDLNIQELVKTKMNYFYQLSLDAFNEVSVDSSKKTMLIELADKLMVREN